MRGVFAVGPPSLAAVSTSAPAWRPTTSGHHAVVLGGVRFFQRTATTTTTTATRQQLSHSRFFTSATVGFDFAGKKKKKKNRRSKEEEEEEEEGEEEIFRVPDSFIQRHGLRDSTHFVSGWKFLSNFEKYEEKKKKEEAKKQNRRDVASFEGDEEEDEEAEAEEQEDEVDYSSNQRRPLDKEKRRERRSSRAKEHLLLLPFDKEKGTLTLTVARGGEEKKERLRLDAVLVSTLNPSHEDEDGEEEEEEEKEKREMKGEKEAAAEEADGDRGRRSVKRKKLEKKKRGKYKANEEEAEQEESAEEEEEDQPMSMNERRKYYMDLLMEKPAKVNTEEDVEEENEEDTEDKRLFSRTTIQRSIKEGNVRVNGVVVKKANYKLAKDDVIVWELDEQQRLSFEDLLNHEEQKSPNNKKEKRMLQEEEEANIEEEEMKVIEEEMFVQFVPEDIPLAVVHEDEDLVVINKAAGMPVQPSPGKTKGTLVNALLHHYAREGLSTVDGPLRPGIVHRLDKDTSGLMVIAKTNEAHQHLKQQFRDRSIMKRYKAIVVGRPLTSDEGDENETTVIRKRIERHPRLIQKMQVVNEKEAESERGKDAITEFSVLDSWRWSNVSLSLLDVQIHTGRMHQIRVHLSSIGHPIVGDKLYANKQSKKVVMSTQTKEQKQQSQLLLASTALSMVHPRTGQRMNFEMPLPPHMNDFVHATKASS